MNPWMAIIGAALGAIRSRGEQSEMNKQRDTEVTRELWSPWTGMHGKSVGNSDPMGRMMQGAVTGVAMGQGMGGNNSPQQPNAYSNVPLAGSRISSGGPGGLFPEGPSLLPSGNYGYKYI